MATIKQELLALAYDLDRQDKFRGIGLYGRRVVSVRRVNRVRYQWAKELYSIIRKIKDV
jgi:hypothetical protein